MTNEVRSELQEKIIIASFIVRIKELNVAFMLLSYLLGTLLTSKYNSSDASLKRDAFDQNGTKAKGVQATTHCFSTTRESNTAPSLQSKRILFTSSI
jgi:hypothetical protein